MFSDKIFFFDLESRESLISALKLSSKEDTPYLKENEIHLDPKHQYEAMRKNGMFNPKNY